MEGLRDANAMPITANGDPKCSSQECPDVLTQKVAHLPQVRNERLQEFYQQNTRKRAPEKIVDTFANFLVGNLDLS